MNSPRSRLPNALLLGALLFGCSSVDSSSTATGAVQALTVNSTAVTLAIANDWGSGYCANVALTNNSTASVTGWSVVVALGGSTLSNAWGATTTVSGDALTATSVGYNGTIAPGQSATFGFCANSASASQRPTLKATTISGGSSATGGAPATGGTTGKGGASATGGTSATGGAPATGGTTTSSCSGPVGTFSGSLATGINFIDTAGNRVNAHGGGIIKVGDTFYMHGEYFLSTTTDNNFHGFSMYSSKDMATWKNEGIILPQQASGLLGPNRKGERPHIIRCPATGEFVLYAHAADVTYQADKEVVYATSTTVNGQYSFKGSLTNASGTIAAHSDMGAFVDGANAYVVTESGHIYQLATDCHSWLTDKSYAAINGSSGGAESPTVFKAGSTYYWIGSYKTGWRANNNFYSTAPAMSGPWTYQGFVAPVVDTANNLSDQRTWLSQSTWVQAIQGCRGTTYVYWGDHWDGNLDTTAPGKHNYLATYVFQPLVFNGVKISMPAYQATWKLDVGAGTWSL